MRTQAPAVVVRRPAAWMVALAAAAALALTPSVARATSLVPMTVEQMAQAADTVVVASVESTRAVPVRGPDASLARIDTRVGLHVNQVLKGDADPLMEIRVAGGTIGKKTFWATWSPTLDVGETAILFLDAQGRPLGPQAKLTVRDGVVLQTGEPAADIVAQVLGAEPLGPPLAARSRLAPASLSLRVPADSARISPLAAPGSDAHGTLRAESFTFAGAQTTFIDDDFEGGLDAVWGLYPGDSGADWVASTQRAATGGGSAYCDDTVAAGGPYSQNAYSWLYAGPFDLSDATAAFLDYDFFLDTQTGDYLSVTFSKGDDDGDGYLDFNGFAYNSPVTYTDFAHDQVDLSDVFITGDDFLGEPEVWVAFIFESDSSLEAEGVYLDNVSLVKNPDVPAITDISPASASAGTNTTVTVTGSGFGATQGSGKVEFTYDSLHGTRIEAPIVSWSDTQIECIVPIVTDPWPAYPGAAGSGPVWVTDDLGRTSAGYDYHVTFAYGQIKWPVPEMDYRFNANTTDTTQEQGLFDAAAQTWNDVTASTFDFSNGGSTTADTYSQNGVNEVFWSSSELGAGTLAAAGIWFTGSVIDEVDVCFNDTYTWGDGSGGSYDIQTIAVHELGHALNLRDMYGDGDSDKIMYGYGSGGAQKRTLHADDEAGIAWIYPNTGLSVTIEASPTAVVPGEDVLYTYTVRNTTQWDMTSVEVSDTVFGLVSTVPTLAPGASDVTTLTWSWGTTGTKTNTANAVGYVLGDPFTASDSVSVDVTLPKIQVTVSATKDPVQYGQTTTLRYRVRNTGSLPVSSVVISDTALPGSPVALAGTIQPGSYKDYNADVTADGAFHSNAFARAEHASVEATDTAPELVVSTYERLAGTDRIQTAIAASKRAYPAAGSASTVVVASALAWPDALPAAGLAGAVDGPLLLTMPTSLPSAVRSEIQRLGANKVYIAGGPGAVSTSVEQAIDDISGVSVERLGGTNRYGTARLIAQEIRDLPSADPDTVFVATGLNFPDALAASSLAAAMPAPILLTGKDSLPQDTKSALSYLGPDTIVVCGGEGVVSDSVESALGSYASTVVRRAGTDRYSTAKSIVTWGEGRLAPPGGVTGVYLAVGTNYPDALAGGVVAAVANGSWNPLMLTPGDSLSSQVSSYVSPRASIEHVGVFGGTGALSDAVLNQAKGLLP